MVRPREIRQRRGRGRDSVMLPLAPAGKGNARRAGWVGTGPRRLTRASGRSLCDVRWVRGLPLCVMSGAVTKLQRHPGREAGDKLFNDEIPGHSGSDEKRSAFLVRLRRPVPGGGHRRCGAQAEPGSTPCPSVVVSLGDAAQSHAASPQAWARGRPAGCRGGSIAEGAGSGA